MISELRRSSPVFVFSLALLACGGDGPTAPANPGPVSLKILPHPDSLVAGNIWLFRVSVDGDTGGPQRASLVWSSSDTAIVRADPDGWMRARRQGDAVIRASDGAASDSTILHVAPAVSLITVAPTDTTVGLTRSAQFHAIILDQDGAPLVGRPIAWATADTFVATIDSSGLARIWMLDSTLVSATSGTATGTAWVRAKARFNWVNAFGHSVCAGTTDERTVCAGSIDYGSGSRCMYGNSPECHALHFMSAPIDTLIPVAGNYSFTCALPAGIATCWGSSSADLPSSSGIGIFGPHLLAGIPALDQLVVNDNVGCGRTGSTVRCWGIGYSALLGYTGCAPTSTPCPPTVVPGLAATDLAIGPDMACAVTVAQRVGCWGRVPTDTAGGAIQVDTLMLVDSIASAASVVFSDAGTARCALTLSGEAWCWGSNFFGELGDGSTAARIVPRRVVGAPPLTSLVSGWYGFCGLDATGAAWCWGLAGYTSALAANTIPCGSYMHCRVTATRFAPSKTFSSLSMAENFACGMATDGIGYCWGGGVLPGLTFDDRLVRIPGQTP